MNSYSNARLVNLFISLVISWTITLLVYLVDFTSYFFQCGKVSVHMHGYSGGYVKTLITAIEARLFVHYTPLVVICQIGGNDCSNKQIWILSLMLALRGEYRELYSCLF